MQSWSRLWGLPTLSQEVKVRFNGRLRTTVARLLSSVEVIEVGPRFVASQSKRREILCHELAHAAANRRRGGRQPHGAEWAALVRRAGFDPVTRLTVSQKSSRSKQSRDGRYEHRCLVCQFVRVARRPVRSWRCAECVRCGLPGNLAVCGPVEFVSWEGEKPITVLWNLPEPVPEALRDKLRVPQGDNSKG